MLGSAEQVLISIRANKPVYSRAPFIFDLILVAVLLAAMAIIVYLYRVQRYEHELNRMSVALLAQAKAIVRSELDSVAADGLLLTSEAPGPKMQDIFKKLMQLRPHYRHISMIDSSGKTIIKVTRTAAEPVAISMEQLSLEPVVSPTHRGLSGGPGSFYASAPTIESDQSSGGKRGPVVYFTAPFFGERLTRLGAIIISYDVDGLLATARTMRVEPHGSFDLVDTTGKAIDSATQTSQLRFSQYVWTTDLAIISSAAPHADQLVLRYHIDEDAIALDKRNQALWAFAFWLVALGPTAGLLFLARGARISDQAAKIALAQSEERLLEAEHLARIGHWHWQPQEGLLVLSPQAASMLGCPPGDQHKKLQDMTALHAFEDEQRFTDRVQQVMDTGETSSADVRVVMLRGERWLHSIIRPARNDAGAIVGVFGTLQDISTRKKLEQDLGALKADYAALLDHLPAGVMYMDLDGRWALVNEGFLKLTGATREAYEGRHYLDTVLHPDAERLLKESFDIMHCEPAQLERVQTTLVHSGPRWFQIDRVPRRDLEGKAAGLVVLIVDITSLKMAEEQLRALTAEREIMLNRIPAGVVYKAIDGRIIRANRVATGFAGIPAEAMEGRRLDEVYPLGDHELANRIDAEVIRTGKPTLGAQVSGKTGDGTTYWFEINVFPDFDTNGNVNGIVVFGLDITQRKQAEEQAAYLAMHDPLTDLSNRRLLIDRLLQTLAHCARRSRHCALLFIDLDHFKKVNDLHGHDIGDLLLVQVAQLLRACVRTEDTVSRIGGDEFVVLLSDTSSVDDALRVAEKIRVALGTTFTLRGVSAEIGCSIGIASYPEHGRTEHELLCAADTAMYAAKAAGRNTICVSSSSEAPSRHDIA